MEVSPLPLKGLKLIESKVFRDDRGFFVEKFQTRHFGQAGLPTQFFQDNHSRSLPCVLRGIHYQANPDQGKLVGVVRGRIYDVAVDLRRSSTTFGQWYGIELSDDSGQMLWIPAGFGHGFCVLGTEPADVFYKADAPYSPSGEGGIRWDDPDLKIRWPLQNPRLSERDQRLPAFSSFSLNW